jgi:hypothetical protein
MTGPVDPAPTMLDELLPAWDHRTMHGHATSASLEAAVRAVHEVTLGEARMARTLVAMRTLGRARGERLRRPWMTIGEGDQPFVPLGATEREVALGFVGRPWPGGGAASALADRAAFEAHQPTDDVKVAMSVRAQTAEYGTLLVAETRIQVGREAAGSFGAYWRVIRFGSGLVRSSLLRAIARRAEQAEAPVAAADGSP